jgi:hypothetical protein
MAAYSQAFAVGGVVGNVGGTLSAVLNKPVVTVRNLVVALPEVAKRGAAGVRNTVAAVPGVLTGGPIKSTSTKIVVPLPGPGIVDAQLAQIPGEFGVDVASGGGSVDVTIVTGH